MKNSSTLMIAVGAALLFAGTATLAKENPSATAAVRDVRPSESEVKVDPKFLVASSASEKSQGLPNADGEKPGKGNGYGHFKDVGRGHDLGFGHGHDSDPESP